MPQRYQRLYAACCVAILAFLLFNRQASKAAARYGIRLYDCRDGSTLSAAICRLLRRSLSFSRLLRWLIRLSRWLRVCWDGLYDCRDGFAVVEMPYTIVEMVSLLLRCLIRLSRWLRVCWDGLYDCRDDFAFVEMTYTIVEMASRLLRWLIRLSRWLIRLSRWLIRLSRWLIRLLRRFRGCRDDSTLSAAICRLLRRYFSAGKRLKPLLGKVPNYQLVEAAFFVQKNN